MRVQGYLRRIERSRYLRRDVSRSLSRKKLRYGAGIGLFLTGFVLLMAFSLSIQGRNVPDGVIGAVVTLGIVLAVSAFPVFSWAMGAENKLKFIDGIIEAAKNAEVLYLFDSCFRLLHTNQRIAIAQKLIASGNLPAHELLGEFALAKKALYLTPERVRDFLKTERLGMVSRINESQLKVLESETLIRPEELARATAEPRSFYRDPRLRNVHRDPFWEQDTAPLERRLAVWEKFMLLPFAVGGLLLAVMLILMAALGSQVFLYVAAGGFVVAFSTAPLHAVQSRLDDRVQRVKAVVNRIERQELFDLADSSLDGLSLEQRMEVCGKLIASGKVTGRVLLGDVAVAKVWPRLTPEQARAKLAKERAAQVNKTVVKIRVDKIRTNCPACGGAYPEGAAFCPHCGTKRVGGKNA